MINVRFYLMDPTGKREELSGFKYLWLKQVFGFDESFHCAKCLQGRYIKGFNPDVRLEAPVTLHVPEDSVLYFCGVTQHFDWSKNLHLAAKVKDKSIVEHQLFNGVKLVLINAEQIHFDDEAARKLYPDRPERYLSCRNFQFGAQYYRGQ